MKKILLILIGIAIGYFVGFQDAGKHDETIVARLVARVGGDHRANVITDVDGKMRDLER
jgi:hypothetical protein